ncbi:MAG: FAD-binding protein, partial [Candidatus Ratteibacteria bacterium]
GWKNRTLRRVYFFARWHCGKHRKMNKILEIDQHNLMAHLEAGVMLKEFYHALKTRKFFFPPHFGEESATIGAWSAQMLAVQGQ